MERSPNNLIVARPEMAHLLRPQQIQLRSGFAWTPEHLEWAIRSGPAFALVSGDSILAIGGISQPWPDRGVAWCVISDSISATMVSLHRVVRRGLDFSPCKRIEAYVYLEHAAGAHWVEMLGFEREGLMRSFHNGQDFLLYAKVR